MDFHRVSESQHFKLGDTSCLVSWRHFINTKHLEATMYSGNSTSYFFVCLGLHRALSNLRSILSTMCVLNMSQVEAPYIYKGWWQACSSVQTWPAGADAGICSQSVKHRCKDGACIVRTLASGAIMQKRLHLLYLVASFWCVSELEGDDEFAVATNSHQKPVVRTRSRSGGR